MAKLEDPDFTTVDEHGNVLVVDDAPYYEAHHPGVRAALRRLDKTGAWGSITQPPGGVRSVVQIAGSLWLTSGDGTIWAEGPATKPFVDLRKGAARP